MRGHVALAAVALLAVSAENPASAIEGSYEPATTRVAVKLTERLSSGELKAGDTFGFDTSASALVDGMFLPARTHGHGIVVAARPGRGAQPGLLALAARSLDAPNGDAIPVGLEPGELDRHLHGDERAAPAGASVGRVVLGAQHATNVVYEKGTAFFVIAPPPNPSPSP